MGVSVGVPALLMACLSAVSRKFVFTSYEKISGRKSILLLVLLCKCYVTLRNTPEVCNFEGKMNNSLENLNSFL